MKVVLTLIFLLTLHADHVSWRGDYDKALEKAKESHKPLMIYLVKKPCPLCNDILRQIFMNQPYIKGLNKRFVSVIVTFEGAQNYPVEMYYSTTFPTLFFVDSDSEHFLAKPLFGKHITKEAIKQFVDE